MTIEQYFAGESCGERNNGSALAVSCHAVIAGMSAALYPVWTRRVGREATPLEISYNRIFPIFTDVRCLKQSLATKEEGDVEVAVSPSSIGGMSGQCGWGLIVANELCLIGERAVALPQSLVRLQLKQLMRHNCHLHFLSKTKSPPLIHFF